MRTPRLSRVFNLCTLVLAAGITAAPAGAKPPPENSPQWRILSTSREFIKNMRGPDGKRNCCDLDDGRGGMEEVPFIGLDGKQWYRVRITREAFAGSWFMNTEIPAEGKWIEVGPDKVLTPQHAAKYCDKWRENNAALLAKNPELDTCYQPDVNIIWYSGSDTYCYWPKPKNGRNQFLQIIPARYTLP